MTSQSLWAVFLNGVLMLTGLFGLLLAAHWSAAKRWWRDFGRALQDIEGREQ